MNSHDVMLPRLVGRARMVSAAVIAAILIVQNAALADNRRIYSDFLNTGWTALYSSADVNLSARTPVHAGTASMSVTAGASEALYLFTPDISTVGYTGLTFWVNGGVAGGQALEVRAVRGGVIMDPVQLPALPTNAWRAVSVPLSALGVASAPDLNGFLICARDGQPVFYVDDMYLIAGVETDPVPRLSRLVGMQTNPFTFVLSGRAGETYVTELSTDLVTWRPISTNVLSSTSLYVSIPVTNNPCFFRAIWRQ